MEEQPVATPQPNPTPTPTSPASNRSPKWLYLIIAILLLLVALLGGYLFLNKSSNKEAVVTPTPTQTAEAEPTDSTTPTQAKKELVSFSSQKLKDISFSGYSLKYPSDWTKTYDRDEGVGTAKLKLAKEDYSVNIQQGPMGGSLCVYKDSEVPGGEEAMFTDKRGHPYVDLITSIGTLRRDESKNGSGEIGYSFCQKSETDESFGSFTKVGAMSYSGPVKWDNDILDEMDEIVKSIKTL